MNVNMLCAAAFLLSLLVIPCRATESGNRLTYLDEFCSPYHVGREFPKLTTPQWVGEEGVDAVVVLSIDDMRGHPKWETYLRPIIDRLKKIDGRAPVSILTCRIDPREPHLQQWLKEGLSLEVHTIDHPCPCLQGSDFPKAAKTYHDCVDLLAQIPNSHPVAFRMPCCDSRNTPSPRFWSEIFNKTSAKGNFLRIDSSVFNITTPEDKSLPREVVTDSDGKSRFRRYVPFASFVNTIEDYPYPYVIGRLCWQFPCAVPSDWSAQHVQRPNNPQTVRDMQRALDAAVLKRGVFTLVFHPHGWIRSDQIIQLIDYAEKTYGRRVKFLNFRECSQRISKNLLNGQTIRDDAGRDNGVRILDVNNDGYMDVVIANERMRQTRVWSPQQTRWHEMDFPLPVVAQGKDRALDVGVRFGILKKGGQATLLVKQKDLAAGWHFTKAGWKEDERLANGLKITDREVLTAHDGIDQGARLRDLDGDGICELIAGGPDWQAVFRWDETGSRWQSLPFTLPANAFLVDKQGRDAGLRFVDINGDGRDDVIFSNTDRWSAHTFTSMEKGWSVGVAAQRADDDLAPAIVRGATNNGGWFHSRHLWLQNEDTHRLPDGVARLALANLLERIQSDQKASGKEQQDDNALPDPKTPADALRSFKTKPGLKLELVAAEPLVVDPVAFDWGPDGRLWVVEMRDYPQGLDGKGKPGGRVKVLSDSDNDGRYDHSELFLDGLPFPTGVKVWRDGVLVTAAPRILYARDTDDDGRSDEVQTLYEGFGEGNQQHRVNGLRWGLDNWLYVGNGDSGGTIRSVKTGEKVDVRSRDLRIRPDSGELEAISGNTQFGINRDDWGNWFGGNNSHPVWHYVLNDAYLRRNPHFAPPNVKREISQSPGAATVFPISSTLERFNNPQSANRFTSACSPMIYRDRYLGEEFYGNVFVCEPVHNLVHREIVTARGATFASRRADDERESEFLASNDSWFRPAMIRTGPDGALWVADMYRLVIEHPKWIPAHFQKRYDLRAGDDRGRIYRIVPQGQSPRLPRLDKLTIDQLVARLSDKNGTVRDLAQQMLVWKDDDAASEQIEQVVIRGKSPLGRLHALCTLDGIGKLSEDALLAAARDKHPAVRRHAIRVGERFKQSPAAMEAFERCVDDVDIQVRIQLAYSAGEWSDHQASGRVLHSLLSSQDDYLRAAAMSSLHRQNVGHVLVHLARKPDPSNELFGEILGQAGFLGAEDALLTASDEIARPGNGEGFANWQIIAANNVLEQISGVRGKAEFRDRMIVKLKPMFADARRIALRQRAAADERGDALALLRWAPPAAQPKAEQLLALMGPANPPQVQRAAVELMVQQSASQPDAQLIPKILAQWSTYTPALRHEVFDSMLRRPTHTGELLKAIEDDTVPASQLGAVRRSALLDHADSKVRARAQALLGPLTKSSREEVLKRYAVALTLEGNKNSGQKLFAKHCASCHRIEGVGSAFGPDLSAITNRSRAALLEAILDPNRAVEDKFVSYSAVTDDGRVYSGMLESEAGASITLRSAGGKAIVLLRNRLDEFRSNEKSFMPEGLEMELNAQQVADVMAYLHALGPPPKTFAGNSPRVVKQNEDGVIHLSAASARIFGSRIVFEPKHKNLGWWCAEDDRAEWTVNVAAAGRYVVEIDYACHNDTAGDTFQLQAGEGVLRQQVAGTGSWDNYRWRAIGHVQLNEGPQEIICRSHGPIRGALIDLRTIRLTPAEP